YIRYLGGKEQHRLVGVVDYAELSPIRHSLNNYSVYGVFMHEHLSVDLTYGCGKMTIAVERSFALLPVRLEGRKTMERA
ncbi:MAG: AraC family transcriptional regulator, partial [Muribaculaceae bacterium]